MANEQIKDALAREAVLINGQPVSGGPTVTTEDALPAERALHGRFYLVRFGKKLADRPAALRLPRPHCGTANLAQWQGGLAC